MVSSPQPHPAAPPTSHSPGAGAPNCWRCQYLGASHDARLPYLCRLMDIRSAVQPSIAVLRADGTPCRGYRPKAQAA